MDNPNKLDFYKFSFNHTGLINFSKAPVNRTRVNQNMRQPDCSKKDLIEQNIKNIYKRLVLDFNG